MKGNSAAELALDPVTACSTQGMTRNSLLGQTRFKKSGITFPQPSVLGRCLPRQLLHAWPIAAAPKITSAASNSEVERPEVTPTTDTNAPGHCCTQANSWSTPCSAVDGAGHLDRALQVKRSRLSWRAARLISATAGNEIRILQRRPVACTHASMAASLLTPDRPTYRNPRSVSTPDKVPTNSRAQQLNLLQ
jgi:hypothetical protein